MRVRERECVCVRERECVRECVRVGERERRSMRKRLRGRAMLLKILSIEDTERDRILRQSLCVTGRERERQRQTQTAIGIQISSHIIHQIVNDSEH